MYVCNGMDGRGWGGVGGVDMPKCTVIRLSKLATLHHRAKA